MGLGSGIKILKIKKRKSSGSGKEQPRGAVPGSPGERENTARTNREGPRGRLSLPEAWVNGSGPDKEWLGSQAGQKLIESFRVPKSAERKEHWNRSEISLFPKDVERETSEVFVLTRKLLTQTLGPLNPPIISDDSLMEKALGRIYSRLPIPIRLALWKKRYIQFILANRERLIS